MEEPMIEVVAIVDNPDGSATMELMMNETARDLLLEKAVLDALKQKMEGIKNGEKTSE